MYVKFIDVLLVHFNASGGSCRFSEPKLAPSQPHACLDEASIIGSSQSMNFSFQNRRTYIYDQFW